MVSEFVNVVVLYLYLLVGCAAYCQVVIHNGGMHGSLLVDCINIAYAFYGAIWFLLC